MNQARPVIRHTTATFLPENVTNVTQSGQISDGNYRVTETSDGFTVEMSQNGTWTVVGTYADRDTADEIVGIANSTPRESYTEQPGPASAVPFSTINGDMFDPGESFLFYEQARPASYVEAVMMAPPGQDPVDVYDSPAELGAAIDDALSLLTDRQRELFERTIAGESKYQIGAALGISSGAVQTNLERAKKKMRAHLEGRPVISAATEPERYEMVRVGPPEPTCGFCSPPAMRYEHSKECPAKGLPVVARRLPIGVTR